MINPFMNTGFVKFRNNDLLKSLRNILWIIFIACINFGCREANENREYERPNIVLIMTDDQGFGDLGLHGNPVIRTPTLDSLGRLSKRFTNFYVSPVCAPTRSSLMTGRYSLRTGVYDTYNGGAIMSDGEKTLAEYLKGVGYATGIFGKWHLGDAYPYRPQDQGFDVTCIHWAGGIGQPGDFYDNFIKGDSCYFNPVIEVNGIKTPTSGYCTDVFTDLAMQFIQEHREDPFFAYISYNAPHTPLQVPENYLLLYDSIRMASARYPDQTSETEPMTNQDFDAARRVYAMVSNIDDNLKKIWHALQDAGISEKTLIIFLTDNGPQQWRYNAGLKGKKGSVYEGGIRVPSFWYWPGRIVPGDNSSIAAHIDILPTLLDICGIMQSAEIPLDGISLLPVLAGRGEVGKDRRLVHYWHRGYPEPYHNIAFRAGHLKLVGQGDYRMNNSEFEMYDISTDPGERVDISHSFPEAVDSLRKEFDRWYTEIMESANLNTLRIHIGTEYQNPVVLNRNDMKGPSAKQWMSEYGMGYWDVFVAESGTYDIRVKFFNPVEVPGSTSVRFGKTQRTIDQYAGHDDLITFENIHLKGGECMVEAWHEYGGKIYAPLYVEVYRHPDLSH